MSEQQSRPGHQTQAAHEAFDGAQSSLAGTADHSDRHTGSIRVNLRRRWLTDHTGRWQPISADGIELFNPETIPIRRYRYRGNKIPNPWAQAA